MNNFSFIPIKGNQILLFAKYIKYREPILNSFLHLSIHEIRSNSRVGPALWSFSSGILGDLDNFDLELIKYTENPLAITFWARFDYRWELFDISTTETDASDKSSLIESGRMDFGIEGLKFKLLGHNKHLGLSKIFV